MKKELRLQCILKGLKNNSIKFTKSRRKSEKKISMIIWSLTILSAALKIEFAQLHKSPNPV